jgi:hypothetical protein
VNQLNANLRTIFDDLVERRLWPVALALVIALIAIPVLLSDPAGEAPAPVPAPAVPSTGAGSALPAFEPVVNTEGSKSSEIRKNLTGFDSKDPFKVHGLSSGGGDNSDALGAASAGGGTTLEPGGSTSLGGSGTGTSGTSGSPGTSGSGDSTSGSGSGTVILYDWTATVRFGIGDDLETKRLKRFRALPTSENPVVVFMDVTTDGDSAVFMVSTATGTTGEGDCEPDDTCVFLYMKPGDTQTFEAVDSNDQVVTYTLRLTDIDLEQVENPESSSSSSRAASRRATARAERRARRAKRIARDRRDAGFAERIQAIGF